MSSFKKSSVFFFILATILLLIVGFAALISASSVSGARIYGDPFYYIKQQYLIGLSAALVVVFIFYKIPYQFWRKTSVFWLGMSLLLVLLAFIPQFEVVGETAHRWFKLGPLSLQPSEFLRFFYIIFLAAWLAKTSNINLKSFNHGVIPFIIVLGLISFILIKQPATSIVFLLGTTAIAMYSIAGMKFKHLLLIGTICLIGISALLFIGKGYRLERILVTFFPDKANSANLQQKEESLEGIGSGKILGVGYFNSVKKFQYLPLGFSDYIFAIYAEETGFLGSLALIGLYLFFVLSGLSIAYNNSDTFARYAVFGLIFTVGLQAFTTIAVNIGLLPVTGLPLPFISYGKSNLLVMAMTVGFVLNTAKRKTN